MALVAEGRLIGVTPVAAAPATVDRPAKEAFLKLDVYERLSKKKTKLMEIKAPLAMKEEFEELLDEVLGLPVDIYVYALGKDNADISYTLIPDIPYRIADNKK